MPVKAPRLPAGPGRNGLLRYNSAPMTRLAIVGSGATGFVAERMLSNASPGIRLHVFHGGTEPSPLIIHRSLLNSGDFPYTFLGQPDKGVHPREGKRGAFRGSLNFDEPALPRNDDVHVHVGS